MSSCRLMFLIGLSIILLFHITYAGPASRFALAAVRANNNNKIPRSIRAPFRNSEMMTARGFGKRSQGLTSNKYNKDDFQNSQQWSYGKRDTKYFDDLLPTEQQQDPIEQIFNEQPIESFSIDWFANELSSNPTLAKNVLHRFVDTDKDGFLSSRELLSTPVTASQDSNDLY